MPQGLRSENCWKLPAEDEALDTVPYCVRIISQDAFFFRIYNQLNGGCLVLLRSCVLTVHCGCAAWGAMTPYRHDWASFPDAARDFIADLRQLTDDCSHPDVVRAACYGFDRDDSTSALQRAINSGAAVVLVENVENLPWFVTPIALNSSHQTIM